MKYKLSDLEIATLNFKIRVKKRVETDDISCNKIFHEEQAKLLESTQVSAEAISSLIPAFRRMKSCLTSRRNKIRPKLPKSLKEIIIEGDYELTINKKDKFLIHKGTNNKCLVFCSIDGLKTLASSDNWHADGTFRVASHYYYQLYVIQAWYKNIMIPCCYIQCIEEELKII